MSFFIKTRKLFRLLLGLRPSVQDMGMYIIPPKLRPLKHLPQKTKLAHERLLNAMFDIFLKK